MSLYVFAITQTASKKKKNDKQDEHWTAKSIF